MQCTLPFVLGQLLFVYVVVDFGYPDKPKMGSKLIIRGKIFSLSKDSPLVSTDENQNRMQHLLYFQWIYNIKYCLISVHYSLPRTGN